MNEKELYKLIKIVVICTSAVILLSAIAVPIIYHFKQKSQTIWVHDDIQTDSNGTLSRINYNRSMFNYSGGVNSKPASSDKVEVSLNGNYSQLSQECNAALYSICARNFTVSVGTISLSPLVPMVIANVETGLRADPAITFSSLYPSKILTPTAASDIYSVSCLDVVASAENFKELAAEYWTRDRGPCQMNPSYGVRNDIYYGAMGRSEAALLSNLSEEKDYTAYTTKEGTITVDKWISEASNEKGDRFSPKDICLRLSSEYNYALSVASQTYNIDTELLAIVMCAMHHGAGSLWLPEYNNTNIGLWNSGSAAYELACSLTTQAAYNVIKDEVIKDIKLARSNNTNPSVSIDNSRASSIFNKLKSKGIVKDVGYYTTGGTYSIDYAVYPIKTLYCYIQLSLLYNGG